MVISSECEKSFCLFQECCVNEFIGEKIRKISPRGLVEMTWILEDSFKLTRILGDSCK